MTVTNNATTTIDLDVVTLKLDIVVQVLPFGATSRQADSTSKVDVDVLEAFDSENTVQLVGNTLGEDNSTTILTAVEGRNDVGGGITAG